MCGRRIETRMVDLQVTIAPSRMHSAGEARLMGSPAPRRRGLLHPAAKPVLFVASLLPFAWLFYAALTNQLGANPGRNT
jgi:hypothetical protein